MGVDDGQHGQGERDVGCGGDRPADCRRSGHVQREVEQRGYRHPADRRRDREQRAARVAQVARHELAFQLESGDEEEDREQPVGGPGAQREVQMQTGGSHSPLGEGDVGVPPGGVRPDQCEYGRADQQQPAHGFGAQHVPDPAHLGPGDAIEQRAQGTT